MKQLLLAAAFAFSTLALAAEPELKPSQEEHQAKGVEAMEEPLKALNEKCGTAIKAVKTDYENFKDADWEGRGESSWCPDAVSAIAGMCEARPAYKKAIGKKLTGISCLFAGVKPKEKKDGSNEFTLRNMSFEKGVFTFHLHPDTSNIADNARATFEKALN